MHAINFKSFGFFSLVFLLCSIVMLFLIPERSFESDMHWWKEWARYIRYHDFGKAYTNPLINYQPGFIYLLKLYGTLCNGHFETNVILIKQLIFLFDAGTAFLAGFLLHKLNRSPFPSLLILLNPAFWYTTILWGQCDSMYVFFCLLAIVFFFVDKNLWAVSAFAFAICVKPQAVFIAPVLFIILLPGLLKNPKSILTSLLVFIGSIFLISSPFIIGGNGMRLLELTFSAVDRLPSISMHAFNSWYLFMPGKDLVWAPDTQQWMGLSLKAIGFIVFVLAMIITLRPLIVHSWKGMNIGKVMDSGTVSLVCLTIALLNLDFFFFNTQMHERYIQAAIIFSGISAILSKRYLIFILLSIAYFLNLDFLIHNIGFPPAVYDWSLPYNEILIALIFLSALIVGHIELYRQNSIIGKQVEKDV